MQRLYEAMIQRQLNRLLVCPAKSLLSQRAFCSVREEMEKLAAQMGESGPAPRDGEKNGLPKPLISQIEQLLRDATDGLLEMLFRLWENKVEICASLGMPWPYNAIVDISLPDRYFRDHGRCAAVVATNTGKLVYKPYDMREEANVFTLVQARFSDVLGIPRCCGFIDHWGVSAYIEKQRSRGMAEAALFWRRTGGAAAVMKLLGCADMAPASFVCHGGKPYLLNPEAVLFPEDSEPREHKLTPPQPSGLLLKEPSDGRRRMPMNIDEDSLAPEVDGKLAPAASFVKEFLSGYDEVYRRILENREAIRRELEALFGGLPVGPGGGEKYTYTFSGGRDSFSGGKMDAENKLARSPAAHALQHLETMSEADERLDLSLLRRGLLQKGKKLF